MAKSTCAICGAEVNLLTKQVLADKNCICRKVCAKKCLKFFDFIPATLNDVNTHIEQVEKGTKIWQQIFVPLKSTKVKEEKLKQFGANIYVSPSTGLMALVETRYKFMIFGKSEFACVYKIADLVSYEHETEVKRNSEGKELTENYCRFFFNNTPGLFTFRVKVGVLEHRTIAKYFDSLFGIEKTLGNSLNNAKRQWDAMKSVAGAVKAAATGSEDLEDKAEEAIDNLNNYTLGDRTELIAKAEATLAKVQY